MCQQFNACRYGQSILLKFEMVKKGDLSDFKYGMVIGAK